MSDKNLYKGNEELMRQRYGQRNKRSWRYVALILSLIGIPWLIWSAWSYSNPPYKATVISYETLSDEKITITFTLARRDETQPFLCTLLAEDFDRNVVGEIEYLVKPGPDRTRLTTEIPTRLRPVAASILTCTEAPTGQVVK
ncbi:MAG: DUF4307 domain-containing protein [Candidatus Nanopelagicaceae bacterium]|jgi:hypothetical protein